MDKSDAIARFTLYSPAPTVAAVLVRPTNHKRPPLRWALRLEIAMGEAWKTVPDWTKYEASSHGRIRRTNGNVLRPGLNPRGTGYYMVQLSQGPRKSTRCIHRLVLEAFVGLRPSGQQCRHLNGDSRDNHLRNLTWGTPADNDADAVRHGVAQHFCPGEGHPCHKLTDHVVREIRSAYRAKRASLRVLARQYAVSSPTIVAVVKRRTWRHI